MAGQFTIQGNAPEDATSREAKVSSNGEVIVRSYGFSTPVIKTLDATTPFNLFTPKANEQLVWTGFLVSAARSIDVAGDLVEIFEASAADSATQDKLLVSLDLARQQVVPALGFETLITQGKYLNVDRGDGTGTITITAFGYYVPTISS
jgi:hypothetical protein